MPAPQNEVVEFAARLLGVAPPEVIPLDRLSPAARGFYAENRRVANGKAKRVLGRSEEHTSELQSLMRTSYAVFCLKKKKHEYPITDRTLTKQTWNARDN